MDFIVSSLRTVQNRLSVRSVTFPVVVNHGMHGSQLSQSDSAPSFSNDRAHGHQSTHNITTKFLSAEEHFVFGIGILLHWPVPLYHSSLTVSGRTPDRDERERTETWNQVGSFLLKSRSFELIRSQTTHHYSVVLKTLETWSCLWGMSWMV